VWPRLTCVCVEGPALDLGQRGEGFWVTADRGGEGRAQSLPQLHLHPIPQHFPGVDEVKESWKPH
jgi:hypothetical protein